MEYKFVDARCAVACQDDESWKKYPRGIALLMENKVMLFIGVYEAGPYEVDLEREDFEFWRKHLSRKPWYDESMEDCLIRGYMAIEQDCAMDESIKEISAIMRKIEEICIKNPRKASIALKTSEILLNNTSPNKTKRTTAYLRCDAKTSTLGWRPTMRTDMKHIFHICRERGMDEEEAKLKEV